MASRSVRSTCCRSSSRWCWRGLDTTKSQLGFNFHHLATNPADRARLVAGSLRVSDRDRRDASCVRVRATGTQTGCRHRLRGLPDEEGPDGADAAVVLQPRWPGVPECHRRGGRPLAQSSHRLRRRAPSLRRTAPRPTRAADRDGGVAHVDPGLRDRLRTSRSSSTAGSWASTRCRCAGVVRAEVVRAEVGRCR